MRSSYAWNVFKVIRSHVNTANLNKYVYMYVAMINMRA